jgi:hypothetical protein
VLIRTAKLPAATVNESVFNKDTLFQDLEELGSEGRSIEHITNLPLSSPVFSMPKPLLKEKQGSNREREDFSTLSCNGLVLISSVQLSLKRGRQPLILGQ